MGYYNYGHDIQKEMNFPMLSIWKYGPPVRVPVGPFSHYKIKWRERKL